MGKKYDQANQQDEDDHGVGNLVAHTFDHVQRSLEDGLLVRFPVNQIVLVKGV
jgi:hypothetical protein